MNREIISDKQGITLVSILIIGTSTIYTMGLIGKQDLWISLILSTCMVFPILLICARLNFMFMGKNLFDILLICFGRYFGSFISLLYIWYFFYNSAEILRNFAQFVTIGFLAETPMYVLMIGITIFCIWIVKEGLEVIARWSEVFIFILIGTIFIAIFSLIPDMRLSNIRPVLQNGLSPVIKGAFVTLSYPLCEVIIFVAIFNTMSNRRLLYKVYILGFGIGALVVFGISLTVILVVGVNAATNTFFPTLAAIKRITIGNLFQRVEVIIATLFSLGAFIKLSIYILATCKGVTRVLGFNNYKFLATTIGLLVINASINMYDSVLDYFSWSFEVWPYFAFLFQVILPIFIWLIAEIRNTYIKNDYVKYSE